MIKNIIRQGGITTLAAVFASIFQLLSSITLARIIGQTEYGVYILTISALNNLSAICQFGLVTAITKFTSELIDVNPEKLKKIISNSLILSLMLISIFASITFVKSNYFSKLIFGSSDYAYQLMVVAVAIIFITIDALAKAFLYGKREFKKAALASAFGVGLNQLTIVSSFILLGSEYGYLGLAIGGCFQLVVTLLMIRPGICKFLRSFNVTAKEVNFLHSFAFPAWISGILVSMAIFLVNSSLAKIPDGFEKVAILGVFIQWFNLLVFIPANFSKIILPLLGDKKMNRSMLISSASKVNFAVTFTLSFLIILAFPEIVKHYKIYITEEEQIYFTCFALSAVIVGSLNPVSSLLASSNKMWTGVALNSIWFTIFVMPVLYLSEASIGIISLMYLCAYIIHALLTVKISLKKLK